MPRLHAVRGKLEEDAAIIDSPQYSIAGFSLRGITVLSLLLTLFVKITESTMNCFGA